MDARVNSVLFAKYFLNKAFDKNIDMNMTKLQKMLYAVDGVLLVNDVNLIDEYCRAWEYGSVYPRIYTTLKKEENAFNKKFKEYFSVLENNEKRGIIDEAIEYVIDTLGQYTGKQLSIWSHRDGSPWSETDRGDVIEKSLIKKYFLDSL